MRLTLIRFCPRVDVGRRSLNGEPVVIDFPARGCAFSVRIQKVSISELGRPSRSDLSVT